MIPTRVQVFVALEPIDMRWSFDRLAGAALKRIGHLPAGRRGQRVHPLQLLRPHKTGVVADF